MATKKFSPAQIAAQKLFAERARAGTLGKGTKRKANPVTKMKIERSETPDNPEGIVVTEAGALRFAKQNMPNDLKKAGFVASVFPGARGWVINYGKAVKRNPDKNNPGLYENINAKRKRIAAGSGEKMRKPGQAGRPTAKAFEQSAMTAKRNPEGRSIFNLGGGYFGSVTMSGYNEYYAEVFYRTTDSSGSTDNQIVPDYKPRYFVSAKSAVSSLMRYKTKNLGRKTNPDKSKPRAYVKRASQATGAPPSKRLLTRRKKALSAPAGYFPNPKAAMMTGYQVICMHPKKHVVGIFKTMAEAKMVARAMADAKGVPYGVKAVKVHKTHFAV